MSKNSQTYEEKEWVSITEIMEKYSISRATAIRWAKNDSAVSVLQDGSLLRVNREEFDAMINKKITRGEGTRI